MKNSEKYNFYIINFPLKDLKAIIEISWNGNIHKLLFDIQRVNKLNVCMCKYICICIYFNHSFNTDDVPLLFYLSS